MPPIEDVINHPKHYKFGKYESIDFISGWGYGFCMGNVVKYVTRHKLKGGRQDLEKAAWYLRRGIEDAEVGFKKVGDINVHDFVGEKDLPEELQKVLVLLHRGVHMKRSEPLQESYSLLVKYLESSNTESDGERSNA